MNARLTAWLNNESPMAINNKEIIDNWIFLMSGMVIIFPNVILCG